MGSAGTVTIKPVDTPHYHALPPAPRHAITFHIPGWDYAVRIANKDKTVFEVLYDVYPRLILHRDIKQLISVICQYANEPGKMCLPFPSPQAAKACSDFVTQSPRPDGKESLSIDECKIRAFDFGHRVYAFFFPLEKVPLIIGFWQDAGLGLSSRCAEDCLSNASSIKEIDASEPASHTNLMAHSALQSRIAELIERAPVGTEPAKKVEPDDVYLFPNGMAAIYYVHLYLLQQQQRKRPPTKTVQFGFPFHQTTHIFLHWGPGLTWFPLGTEIDEFRAYLKTESEAGRSVGAVWTEFPSNPLLVSSDLSALRELADEYGFVLLVDETIGSFANLDVLMAADVVVSSLTKSFSGYADVMGGSAVLNPNSPRYTELKHVFDALYRNDLYEGDAVTLVKNSQDYLARSAKLNANAEAVVNYLQGLTSEPTSAVKAVYYPSVSSTKANYDLCKRQPTPEFTPGYGCLFSVECENVEQTIAFYNNLHVHHGPHLGAHLTLALAYTKALYGDSLEEVRSKGLEETQIRISVGLEDTDVLVETFKCAVAKADKAKAKGKELRG